MNATKFVKKGNSILKNSIYLLCIGLMVAAMPSCKKDSNKAHISVRLTDAPASYDAVMVDIQGITLMDDGGIVELNATPGIYNLLDYANGVSTIIATGDLDVGTISQIRLILGSNNSVIVDGVVHPLSTPGAMQSGLKMQVHQVMEAGVSYSILLDFDANQSVVATGNGGYQLKPVIRCIDAAVSGSIRGNVSPVGLIATVTATSGGISYSSVTPVNGEFLIGALPAGTYDITVTPAFPLQPVNITGKTVVIGMSTDLGNIAF